MHPYCFFDGKIIKSDKPLLKLNDIGVLRGFAAFDFMRIYKEKPFWFNDHMKRFKNTCKLMGLKNKYSDQEIKEVLAQLIQKNKHKDYQVRFILIGGETRNGLEPSIPVFYILFEKLSDIPDSIYEKGAKIITHDHLRVLPGAKNSSYMQAVLLQKRKHAAKAIEILYTHHNLVLEASTSNIFIVKNKTLYTPKEDVLKGITRKLIIDIAKKLKYMVKEREISIKELLAADEVFLSATNKKVLPIVHIDSHTVRDGKVGEVTRELLGEYNKLIT